MGTYHFKHGFHIFQKVEISLDIGRGFRPPAAHTSKTNSSTHPNLDKPERSTLNICQQIKLIYLLFKNKKLQKKCFFFSVITAQTEKNQETLDQQTKQLQDITTVETEVLGTLNDIVDESRHQTRKLEGRLRLSLAID